AALRIAHALGVDVLDGRVDRLRILARNRHADAAEHARRQPAAELRPGAAPVLRPVERTARTAFDERPRLAHLVVRSGEEDVRVLRVHGDVDDADLLALALDGQHAV